MGQRSNSCKCCGCEPTGLGSWQQDPTGEPLENDDAEIITVDEFDQVQEVELYAVAASSDREQGYHVRATFKDLQVGPGSLPDVDVVSLFLDGGSHEVRLRYESFDEPHSYGSDCQHDDPRSILVQLWRGATRLAETRVAARENVAGLGISSAFGSLKGTEFCGGFNNGTVDVPHVEAVTTVDHNGGTCRAKILNKGSRLSEEIAVTSLTMTTCKTHCMTPCTTCEDELNPPLSIVLPATYGMALLVGSPVTCSGGTFVASYESQCRWTHASDNGLIYLDFATVSGSTRLRMRVATCLDWECSGHETPVVQSWLSDDLSESAILCGEFVDVPLTITVDETTYTAYVSSV
jgi:hypothetical protein